MRRLRLVAFVALCAFIQLAAAQNKNSRKAKDFNRFGENSPRCALHEFRCRNGQCISAVLLCDGRVDCLDKSDETRDECDKPGISKCTARNFRCDYGACVDGDAPCNGVQDCADGSDESPQRCKNGGGQPLQRGCRRDQYKCDSGQCIGGTELCDGNIDCLDRSDETHKACSSYNCLQAFRCNYGACIDTDLKCNGVVNCADGSDEDPQLCHPGGSRPSTRPTTATTRRPTIPQRPTNERPDQGTDDPYNVDRPRPTQNPGNPWGNQPTQRPPPDNRPPPNRPPSHAGGGNGNGNAGGNGNGNAGGNGNGNAGGNGNGNAGGNRHKTCPLPQQPQNGQWVLDESQCPNQYKCEVPARAAGMPPGSILRYQCNDGYRLNTSDPRIYCSTLGTWSINPVCQAISCPPLGSASRSAECTTRSGDWISCDSSGVPPGTSARLTCRNSYVQDAADLTTRDDVKCNADGQWEPRPINCVSGPIINVNIYVKGHFITLKETFLMVCPAISIMPKLASVKYNTQISVKNETELEIKVQSEGGKD